MHARLDGEIERRLWRRRRKQPTANKLPAYPARATRPINVGRDGECDKVSFPLEQSLAHCRAFGADASAVRSILLICTLNELPAAHEEGASYPELGVGRVGERAGVLGQSEQLALLVFGEFWHRGSSSRMGWGRKREERGEEDRHQVTEIPTSSSAS